MKHANNHESLFWQMLEKNRLVDLSQFHKPGFFEEVPLYSRFADVAFLEDYRPDEANAMLLRFSLKYLRSLISYEEHVTPFLAAITVSNFSPGDPIVPNLFVWSRPVPELYDKLRLSEPSTPFSKRIKRFVSRSDAHDRHAVLQDTEMARVFVAPSVPPYPGFVPIYVFAHTLARGGAGRRKAKQRK